MKKIFTICTCIMMATMSIIAQDIIVTKDAKKIEAKILEVSKTEIKYKEQNNLDGPTFILETTEISSIIYSNGNVEVYQQPSEQQTEFPKEVEENENQENSNKTNRIVERQRALRERQEQERIAQEQKRQQEREMIARMQQQLEESLDNMGKSIQHLQRVKNSYVLEVKNITKYPYKINLDGHIIGVVNGYKVERFLVPVEWYGRMQAVQTKGYMFTPAIREYRIPPQKKETLCSVVIK